MKSEDIFDVVNERDEVIGRERRSVVHKTGLRHRAVHVLVFNANGEVFLQKRSMLKDMHPGTWDSSASGHLDCGEDYDACALREVGEELGHKLDRVPERLLKLDACDETGQEFVWVYKCNAEGPFNLQAEEISEGGWFAPARVDAWIKERPQEFAPAFVYIWNLLKTK